MDHICLHLKFNRKVGVESEDRALAVLIGAAGLLLSILFLHTLFALCFLVGVIDFTVAVLVVALTWTDQGQIAFLVTVQAVLLLHRLPRLVCISLV